jgi:hypothetical protein
MCSVVSAFAGPADCGSENAAFFLHVLRWEGRGRNALCGGVPVFWIGVTGTYIASFVTRSSNYTRSLLTIPTSRDFNLVHVIRFVSRPNNYGILSTFPEVFHHELMKSTRGPRTCIFMSNDMI